jgi:hypothetical protein
LFFPIFVFPQFLLPFFIFHPPKVVFCHLHWLIRNLLGNKDFDINVPVHTWKIVLCQILTWEVFKSQEPVGDQQVLMDRTETQWLALDSTSANCVVCEVMTH